ncbi:PKD domain-containing protein [Cesiribacter sp. SM1]|uniref:PKD domain-containing protein n=1 Tax=Cesiribacter sp. SM1 TaxID=2861196 RepID=UPI001CD2F7DA|nr:PKD domain-containing protein [Cesiribacter sp. SM1]
MTRTSAAILGTLLLLFQSAAVLSQSRRQPQPQLMSYSYDVTSPLLKGVPRDTLICANYPPAPKVTAVDEVDGPINRVTFSEEVSEGPFLNSNLILRQWSATDASGNTAEAYQFIVVRKPYSVAAISAPDQPLSVDSEVAVLAAISHSGNLNKGARANVTWTWAWGDGTESEGNFTDHQVAGSHTYEHAGTYMISLRYEDECGSAVFPYQHKLTIGESSPTADTSPLNQQP